MTTGQTSLHQKLANLIARGALELQENQLIKRLPILEKYLIRMVDNSIRRLEHREIEGQLWSEILKTCKRTLLIV